jgi:ribosomal-protein-alanine N-acetyltransferase
MEAVSDKSHIKCIVGEVGVSREPHKKGLFEALANLHGKAFLAVDEAGLSANSLMDLMNGDASRLYLLVKEEKIISFAVVRTVVDEAELLTIAVLPEKQNSGIGAHLLGFIIDDLLQIGTTHFFLEVRSDNAAALKLYANLGFQQTGRRTHYYRLLDGRLVDAVTQTLLI